ncbi:helix-turn-helix domain-containing protein [Roseobacter fucihabitans]|uniref:helix-turn-helix domain-containing protein n=1 Tax=Roseobacter fucihabitans TaxID=1537242 RepID=UPI003313069A
MKALSPRPIVSVINTQGISPGSARLAIARRYLENSPKPLKEIASLSGFATEQKMRRSFLKLLGTLPTAYRERFGVRCTVRT